MSDTARSFIVGIALFSPDKVFFAGIFSVIRYLLHGTEFSSQVVTQYFDIFVQITIIIINWRIMEIFLSEQREVVSVAK